LSKSGKGKTKETNGVSARSEVKRKRNPRLLRWEVGVGGSSLKENAKLTGAL